jgi:hypothetical protein
MSIQKIQDIGGQGQIKTAYLSAVVGDDQTVLAAAAGKAYQIVGFELSPDVAGRVRLHFGDVATIATKAIGGGYMGAGGGRPVAFGFSGPQSAVNEAIKVSVATAAAADVIVHYIERPS